MFFGVPAFDNIIHQQINITVNDGYDNCSDTFVLKIVN